MSAELRFMLTFEGTDGGLEHHRLRIDSFAPALVELQRAYRRIAQGMLRAAYARSAADIGRFDKFVESLAWEIDTVSHQSPVQITLACPLPPIPLGKTKSLFAEETIDRAADELFDAIDEETKGTPRNAAVRQYLTKLPSGLTRQRYELHKLGGDRRAIEIGHMDRVLETDYPFFVVKTAHIAGVHFPPAPPEIKFLAEGLAGFTAGADREAVDKAIQHRSEPATALFVRSGKKLRTLWLNPGSVPLPRPSREQRDAHYEKRWKELMRALAE